MGGYPLPRSRREAPATVRYQRLGPAYIDPSPSSSEEACLDKLAATAPLTNCGTFSHPGESLSTHVARATPQIRTLLSLASDPPTCPSTRFMRPSPLLDMILAMRQSSRKAEGKGYDRVRGISTLFMTIRDSAFLTLACSRTSHLSVSAVVSSTYFLVSRANR